MILKIIVFGLIRMFVLFILSSGKLKVRRHYNEVYLWQNNVFFSATVNNKNKRTVSEFNEFEPRLKSAKNWFIFIKFSLRVFFQS